MAEKDNSGNPADIAHESKLSPRTVSEDNPQIMIGEGNGVNFLRVEKLGKVALDALSIDKTKSQEIEALHKLGYNDIRYLEDKDTDSKVVVISNGKEIIVAPRGWDSWGDLPTVANIRGVESPIGGEVNAGYHKILYDNDARVLKNVTAAIEELSAKYPGNNGEHLPVHFVTQSYGGALSSLFLAEYKSNPEKYAFEKDIKTVLTFEAPRPGDGTFKEESDSRCFKDGVECVRVVNMNDIVPFLAPTDANPGRLVILERDGAITKDGDWLDDIARLFDMHSSRGTHWAEAVFARVHQEADKQRALLATEQQAAPSKISGGEDIPTGTNVASNAPNGNGQSIAR